MLSWPWARVQSLVMELRYCTLHGIANLGKKERKKERKKRNANGKKEVKLSVLLYIENSKDTTKKLLELISEFGKVAGYKIDIQKSIAFLHTNYELSEKETISLIIPSERIKYLGINLRIIQRKLQDTDERN